MSNSFGKNYLMSARNSSMQRHNAVGHGTPVRHAAGVGSKFGGIGSGMQPSYATGGGADQSATSPLFGITVTNGTATSLSNFDILGAYLYGGQSTLFTNGNYTPIPGVSVSATFGASLNYQQFLLSSQNQVFNVGAIHAYAYNGSFANAQAFAAFTIVRQSQSGATNTLPFKPLVNPLQQQANVTQNYLNFVVDGFTKMTISNLYAGATVEYSFFPQTTVDPSKVLVGGAQSANYGAPQLGLIQ